MPSYHWKYGMFLLFFIKGTSSILWIKTKLELVKRNIREFYELSPKKMENNLSAGYYFYLHEYFMNIILDIFRL